MHERIDFSPFNEAVEVGAHHNLGTRRGWRLHRNESPTHREYRQRVRSRRSDRYDSVVN